MVQKYIKLKPRSRGSTNTTDDDRVGVHMGATAG